MTSGVTSPQEALRDTCSALPCALFSRTPLNLGLSDVLLEARLQGCFGAGRPRKEPFASCRIEGPRSRPDEWLLRSALTPWPRSCLLGFSTVMLLLVFPPFPGCPLGRKSPRKPHIGRGRALHRLVAGRYMNHLGILFMGDLSLVPSLFICSRIYLISMVSWIFILTLDYNPKPLYLFYRSNGPALTIGSPRAGSWVTLTWPHHAGWSSFLLFFKRFFASWC